MIECNDNCRRDCPQPGLSLSKAAHPRGVRFLWYGRFMCFPFSLSKRKSAESHPGLARPQRTYVLVEFQHPPIVRRASSGFDFFSTKVASIFMFQLDFIWYNRNNLKQALLGNSDQSVSLYLYLHYSNICDSVLMQVITVRPSSSIR